MILEISWRGKGQDKTFIVAVADRLNETCVVSFRRTYIVETTLKLLASAAPNLRLIALLGESDGLLASPVEQESVQRLAVCCQLC